jgi:HK97 family phage major capsid protein
MSDLKAMMEERKKLLGDMQELNDRKDFSNLDREQWDRMDARYVELDGLIERAQRAARLDAELRKPAYDLPTVRAASAEKAVAADFAATPEYRNAFARALRTGEMSELRALNTGSSNAPMPVDMQRRIWELMMKETPLRSLARVFNVASDQQITVETAIPTGYIVDESTSTTDGYASPTSTVTESTGTFGRKTIGDFTYAVRSKVSYQAYNDYINGGTYLANKVAQALAQIEEQYLMNGDGSASATGNPAQPAGVVKSINDADNKFTFTGGTTGQGWTGLTADAVIETAHLVSPQYRRGGSLRWIMGDTAAKEIRKLKDGSNRYLWQVSDNVPEGLTNGINGSLYGIPVVISQFMPTATTAASVAFIVGDFSNVEIYDRGPIEFMLDQYTDLAKLNVFLQTWKRSDLTVMVGASGYRPFAHAEFK